MAKIVTREQFLELPTGTIAMEFDPMVVGHPFVSGGKIETNDYVYQELCEIKSDSTEHAIEIVEDAIENGTSFEFDFDCWARDGGFRDCMFIVYERKDVEALIARLNGALKDGYGGLYG